MTAKHTMAKEEFIDPICGMTVDPATAAGSYNHDGRTYYFCSKGCLQKFIAQTEGVPLSGLVQIETGKETVKHEEMTACNGGTEPKPEKDPHEKGNGHVSVIRGQPMRPGVQI